MPNDQLTKPERLRLESLSQSMGLTGLTATERPTIELVFENAERIEAWLKKSNPQTH